MKDAASGAVFEAIEVTTNKPSPKEYVQRNTGEVKPKRQKAEPRKPDPIWDAVAAQWFGGKVAEPDYARVGKIVRDLKAHGATPEEIKTRVRRYHSEWPEAECTPEAMVKHWARFAKEADDEEGSKLDDMVDNWVPRVDAAVIELLKGPAPDGFVYNDPYFRPFPKKPEVQA